MQAFFFSPETKVERKWCTNSKMHIYKMGVSKESGDKTIYKMGVSKESKY